MFKNKEQQFDFYWEEIFNGLAYNPIEFNTYRFDQTTSLPGKVNKLYAMFKVLAMNNQEVMDYLKKFVETFDEKLYETTDDILSKWLEDGILTELIRNAINEEVVEARNDYSTLKERLDSEKAESLSKTNEIATQLKQIKSQGLIPVTHFGVVGDGVTNDHPKLQEYVQMMEEQGLPYMYFPTFTQNYLIEDSIKIHAPDVRIFGDKGMQLSHPSDVPMKKGNILVGGVATTGLDIGAYRDKNDSRNPAGSWVIEGLSFMPAPGVSRGTKNGVELSSMQNGPDRPYLLSKLSFDGMNNAIYMPPNPVDVSIMAANLKITDIVAFRNQRGILLEGPVYGATITNNILEGNTEGCVWGNINGYANISENMFENTKNPVKLWGGSKYIVSKGNYFEYHPTSDYLYHIDIGEYYLMSKLEINNNITSGGIEMEYPIHVTGDSRLELIDPQFKVLFTKSRVKVVKGSNLLAKQGHYAFDQLKSEYSHFTNMLVYMDDGFKRTDTKNEWVHDYPTENTFKDDTPLGEMNVVDLADGMTISQPINNINQLIILNLMVKAKENTTLARKNPPVGITISTSGNVYMTEVVGAATHIANDISRGNWEMVSIPIHFTAGLAYAFKISVPETYRGEMFVAGATSKDLGPYGNVGSDGITKVSPVRPDYKKPTVQ